MPTEQKLMPKGWEDLLASKPYQQLLPKQRVWVAEYIRTGDRRAATALAYPKANLKSQRIMSYHIPRYTRVADVLEFWKWRDARAQLVSIALTHLADAEPGSTAAQGLLTQLERLLIGIKMGRPVIEDANEPEDNEPETVQAAQPTAPTSNRVPAGCRAVIHKDTGELLGYITPSGERVPLATVEVNR